MTAQDVNVVAIIFDKLAMLMTLQVNLVIVSLV